MSREEIMYKGFLGYFVERNQWNVSLWLIGFVVCAALAYLLGSLNFALIISKYRFGGDVRESGSSNAGATNMMRTYGKTAAIFTFLGDASKAALAALIGTLINGQWGAAVAGFFCILGHVYPCFFGFKGGKGVVVAAITVLCMNPPVFAVLLIIFIIIVASTKYISLGSIMCMLMYPVLLYNMGGAKDIRAVFAIATSLLIIWLHRDNMARLREGKENKFSFKKSVKPDKARSKKSDE